jgi:protein CpxP
MKKQSILYILLIFLTVSTGFFLFHYLGKKGPHKQKPEHFIVKELGFDEKQMNAFDSMSDLHFDRMKTINGKIKELKDNMFSEISNTNMNAIDLDAITTAIGEQEKNKDIEVFNHLQKVRGLCNDEQKQRFTKIVNDAMNRHKKRDEPKENR